MTPLIEKMLKQNILPFQTDVFIEFVFSLQVLGKLDEFDKQVRYVIQNVSFNADAVVSVFETNIRVLG